MAKDYSIFAEDGGICISPVLLVATTCPIIGEISWDWPLVTLSDAIPKVSSSPLCPFSSLEVNASIQKMSRRP